MISVIIPLYNKEKSIANTLRTVLKQTFQDFEIVVVNDGSTDNSLAEAESVEDDRIRIVNQENAGVSAARNKGIEEAKYDLVAFLDADDEWTFDHLERVNQLYLSYPIADVYATSYYVLNEFGGRSDITLNRILFEGQIGLLTNYFDVASCSSPPLWTSAVAARKTALLGIGGFPVGVASGEDLLTWARLASKYVIAYDIIPTAIYHITLNRPIVKIPVDLTTTSDVVGVSLETLLKSCDGVKVEEIRKYISYWYKMRSSINLSLNNREAAGKCAVKALRYNFCNIKVYLLLFLSILPQNIVSWFIKKYRKL